MEQVLKTLLDLLSTTTLQFTVGVQLPEPEPRRSVDQDELKLFEALDLPETNALEKEDKRLRELVGISLQNFMHELMQHHPKLEGNIIQCVLTDNGHLVMIVSEEGSRYCAQRTSELEEAARIKLGVNRIYLAETDSKVPLRLEDVEDIVDNLYEDMEDNEDERDARVLSEHDRTSVDFDPSLYTLEELVEIANEHNLSDIALPKKFCSQIINYLWEQKRDHLLNHED